MFITLRASDKQSELITVNMNLCVAFRAQDLHSAKTKLIMVGGEMIYVQETEDQIKSLLYEIQDRAIPMAFMKG